MPQHSESKRDLMTFDKTSLQKPDYKASKTIAKLVVIFSRLKADEKWRVK